MILRSMRFTDITLNFNDNMSTTAVFLDIDKAFDTIRHLDLLYKLTELKFLHGLIKIISSFLSQRKFTCIYPTDRKNGYVLRKLQ
jgi:hypothetical protein